MEERSGTLESSCTVSAVCQVLLEYLYSEKDDTEGVNNVDLPLNELGVDSFALIELTLLLEQKFGFSLPLGELTPDNTRTLRTFAQTYNRLNNTD